MASPRRCLGHCLGHSRQHERTRSSIGLLWSQNTGSAALSQTGGGGPGWPAQPSSPAAPGRQHLTRLVTCCFWDEHPDLSSQSESPSFQWVASTATLHLAWTPRGQRRRLAVWGAPIFAGLLTDPDSFLHSAQQASSVIFAAVPLIFLMSWPLQSSPSLYLRSDQSKSYCASSRSASLRST